MSLEPTPRPQPPAATGPLEPYVALAIALGVGAVAAYFTDWQTAFTVFLGVISLLTPRPKAP